MSNIDSKRFTRLHLVLIATAFAIGINITGILGQLLDIQNPKFLLNGIDEISYLNHSISIAEQRSPDRYYLENDKTVPFKELLFSYRGSLVDYTFGSLPRLLNLSTPAYGLALDLFFSLLSFYCFYLFFYELYRDRFLATFNTTVALIAPQFLCLETYFHFKFPNLTHFVSSPIGMVSGLPIQRALYTQVSYPLFALAMFYCIRGLKKDQSINFLYSGILSGLLIFVYFFAWGSSLLLIGLISFVIPILCQRPKLNLSKLLFRPILFILGSLIFSVPGMFILKSGGEGTVLKFDAISQYFYLPGVVSVLLFATLTANLLFNLKPIYKLIYAILSCCFISQIALMNLQPLLGSFLAPYRFIQLYIHPIVSTSLLSLPIIFFSHTNLKSISRYIFCLLLLVLTYRPLRMVLDLGQARTNKSDLEEIVAKINNSTNPSSVIAVLGINSPFSETIPKYFPLRTEPNLINTLTGRYLLHQDWIILKKDISIEALEREMLQGYLFTGEPRLLWPCTGFQTELPGDLFDLTWTVKLLLREQLCFKSRQLIENPDICKIAKKYQFDYLVWEHKLLENKPPLLNQIYETVWTSSSKDMELLHINRDELIKSACEGQEHY